MSEKADFNKCVSYIDCHAKHLPGPPAGSAPRKLAPSVTISRQTGSGGRAIAERLAIFLQSREARPDCPWTIFDKNLVEKVLEDHHLPKRLAQYMSEDRKSMIDDIMEELLGLHPPSWTLLHQTTETILRLADMGHVILIGRGANVIANRMENVFHVRLIASLELRIERVCAALRMDRRAAEAFILREEEGRRRYLKKNFGKDPEDPLLYHLILNTDRFTEEAAARLIGNAVIGHFCG
jgi:hypothetical protein